MISKENIRKGLDSGLISITSDQGGCCGICCKIGDYAFYFLDFDEDVLLEEFWTKYSKEEVITMIGDVIKNKETAEKNGLSEEEQGYYEGLLKSN